MKLPTLAAILVAMGFEKYAPPFAKPQPRPMKHGDTRAGNRNFSGSARRRRHRDFALMQRRLEAA